MDSVTIIKNITLLDDCESQAAYWTAVGSNSVEDDSDAGDFQRGTQAIKITVAAGSAAGTNLAYSNYPSNLNISALDTICLWLKSSVTAAAGDLQIVLDNDASLTSVDKSIDLPALAANTWKRVALTGQTLSAINSLSSFGIKMVTDLGAFTLHIDDVIAGQSKDYDILSLRGFHKGESTSAWPILGVEPLLDGTLDKKVSRFRREVTVQFQAFDTEADLNWLQDAIDLYSSVRVINSDDEVEGVTGDEGFQSQWLGGFSQSIGATIQFSEKTPLWSTTRKPPSFA